MTNRKKILIAVSVIAVAVIVFLVWLIPEIKHYLFHAERGTVANANDLKGVLRHRLDVPADAKNIDYVTDFNVTKIYAEMPINVFMKWCKDQEWEPLVEIPIDKPKSFVFDLNTDPRIIDRGLCFSLVQSHNNIFGIYDYETHKAYVSVGRR